MNMHYLNINFGKENKDTLVAVTVSIFVLFSLTTKWEVIPQMGQGSSLADIINRFAYSFRFNAYADLFVFIGSLILIKNIRYKSNQRNHFALSIAAIFSALYICSVSYMNYADLSLINYDVYQFGYSFFLWIGTTLIIYYSIKYCLYFLVNHVIIEKLTLNESSRLWRIYVLSFITIILGWGFWLVCTYPGNCNIDAIAQLIQYFSGDISNWTTHHPPLSTFIMGTLVRVGQILFKSSNVGFFAYLLLQTVIGASVISYGVYTLKKHFAIKNNFLTGIVIFFAIVPFWGVYAALYEKSLLYSEFALLVTILIIPVVSDEAISNRRAIALAIASILAALLRNNGIYAIVPTMIALIIYLKGVDRKRTIGTFICIIVVIFSVNNILYPHLGIEKGSIAEALSLPFQQTAKYVKYYGNELTDEEKNAIDSVLSLENLGELYNPIISNPVKDTYKRDDSKLENYFIVWTKMFFKHPGIYFSAFMDSSYGYLAPVSQSIEATTDFDYETTGLQVFGLTKQAFERGVNLTNSLRTLSLTMPVINYFCMPGLYTWLLMLAIIGVFRNKKYNIFIVFIPAMINIMVCFASPLSSSMRYSHPTVMMTPFLLAFVLSYIQNDRK